MRGETLARRWLIDLATGLGRSFTVPDLNYFSLFAPASWAVNAHLTVGMDPSTGFVVYNTLAWLFTGAKPRGEVAVGDTRKLYLFSSGASAIAAAWSFADDGRPAPLRIPGGAKGIRALDVLGNAAAAASTVGGDLRLALSGTPLYLQPVGIGPDAFAALLAQAVVEAP